MVEQSISNNIGEFIPTGRILGDGVNGDVKEVICPDRTKRAAMKIITSDNQGYERLRSNLRQEIEILLTLDHPNVVKVVGYSLDANWISEEG